MVVCCWAACAAGRSDIGVTPARRLAHEWEAWGRWWMAQRYNLAELHGGPLDGQLVQVPVREDGQPERVVGVPGPVRTRRQSGFWWDTGNYFFLSSANPPKPGRHWYHAYARTLPGYPTISSAHDRRMLGGPRADRSERSRYQASHPYEGYWADSSRAAGTFGTAPGSTPRVRVLVRALGACRRPGPPVRMGERA